MSVNDITTSSSWYYTKTNCKHHNFSVFYIKSSSQTQGKEIVFHIIYLFKKKKKKPNLPGWDSNCEPFTLWKTVNPIGRWQLMYKLCKICILIYIAFASVVCLKLDIEWKINLFGRILRLFFIILSYIRLLWSYSIP